MSRNSSMTIAEAAKAGRRGDDRLAHITGYEAAVLRGLGGAGTINPKTGLEEFYTPEGGAGKGKDTASGSKQAGRDRDRPGQSTGGTGQGGHGGASGALTDAVRRGSTEEANMHSLDMLGQGATQRDWNEAVGKGRDMSQSGHGGGGAVGSTTAADRLMADKYGVSPDRYNQETADYRDRLTDAYGTDDSLMDVVGNFLGGLVGLNEQTPDEVDFDPQNPVGPDVSWGFDPVGPLASAAGMLLGGPLGPGIVADQISEYFGRPFEVDLGPSVLGFDGGETVTGPTTGVREPGGTGGNTYFGLPPEYAQVANLVSNNAAPRPVTSTYTGTDQPTTLPPEPAPPTAELPVDAAPAIPPDGVQVDAGNTNLSPTDLTALFTGYMQPRTLTGKNRMRVIV